jgi:uncharacterized protein YhfF
MKKDHNEIKEFWGKFCETLPKEEKDRFLKQNVNAWAFGDSAAMADDLLAYVLTGEKTATSGMLKDYEIDGDPVPEIGERSIILNGKGEPICIVEITNVIIQTYNEVDERFALAEGEGFKSLEDWKKAHWEFFTRRCKILGIDLSESIPLVCEEFKVIYI